jgi:sporulation protein YlmC with PRC-barrel domain
MLAASPLLMAQTKMPSHAEPITGTFLSVQASNQWLATQLIGITVVDAGGEKIGSIDDLVIDQSGAIQAVIIGVGGFLGIGAKDIAVSLQTMTIVRDSNGDRASVKLSRQEIERAPSFQRFTGKPVESLSQASPKSK